MGNVRDNTIECPYHGWRFDALDGRCARVPSLADQSGIPRKARIATYPTIERYGHVWTVLDEPAAPMYDPVELQPARFNLAEYTTAEPITCPTGVAVAMENFRDVAHFPFVHAQSIGPTPEVVEPLHISREELHVRMDLQFRASSGKWSDNGDCVIHFHCIAPGFFSVLYEYERPGKRSLAIFPSPISYEEVVLFHWVATDREYTGMSIDDCLKREVMLTVEDVHVLSGLRPREVPWDREFLEVSVPADALTLNYRRAFWEFVRACTTRASSKRTPRTDEAAVRARG